MDAIEEIQRLRDKYEAALGDAEQWRDEYHRAIKKLHLSGVPLREIAEQLGLSHQRVHQIITGQPPPRRRGGKAARAGLATLAFLSATGLGIVGGYAIWNEPTPPQVTSTAVASNIVSTPRVTGLPVFRAQRILRANGICVTSISAAGGTPSDAVSAQSLPAGSLVPKLTGVSLQVPGEARGFSIGRPGAATQIHAGVLLPVRAPGPAIAVDPPTGQCGNELRVFGTDLRFITRHTLVGVDKESAAAYVVEVRGSRGSATRTNASA